MTSYGYAGARGKYKKHNKNPKTIKNVCLEICLGEKKNVNIRITINN